MSDSALTKKYNHMENILIYIMKNKISLSDDQVKMNNPILTLAINQIVCKIKEKSPLFKTLFQEIFYGGSYYDGLKTGEPKEYDLDLLLKFPKNVEVKLKPVPNVHGFVTIELVGNSDVCSIQTLLDGKYFSTSKMLTWMESLVAKAIKEFPASGDQHVIMINKDQFYMKISKSGPAFTLKLSGSVQNVPINFDVDLVPCFLCNSDQWPKQPFRQDPGGNKDTFFIVPKIPKTTDGMYLDKSWRLSFQVQERTLINGYKTLKPCIKLLKKLRDFMEQKSISSYFIKTIFLWEVTRRDKTFWDYNSLSFVFMEMLQVYANHLIEKSIKYFWNENNNLLSSIDPIILENYGNRLKRMIPKIMNAENPFLICQYYLSPAEIEIMKTQVVMCKKNQTYLDAAAVSLVAENNSAIKANIGNININTTCNGEYEMILKKLDSLHSVVQKINEDMTQVKNDNATLRCSMQILSDKLDIADSKFSQLEQQNRLLLLKLKLKNDRNSEELLDEDLSETSGG